TSDSTAHASEFSRIRLRNLFTVSISEKCRFSQQFPRKMERRGSREPNVAEVVRLLTARPMLPNSHEFGYEISSRRWAKLLGVSVKYSDKYKRVGRKRSSSRHQRSSSDSSADLISFDDIRCGRTLAWFVLQQFDEHGRFINDVLNEAVPRFGLSTRDRAAALEIASGVLRRRRTLDTLIEAFLSRSRIQVEPDLWRLLQIGAFQVALMTTPQHAAVDSTVELTRRVGRDRWSGFVNGVVRNIARSLSDEQCDEPSPAALPTERGQFRRLKQPIFANPADQLSEYIGQAFSLPPFLADRWSQRWPLPELLDVCFHSIDIPDIVLRVNRLVKTRDEMLSILQQANVVATPGDNPWAIHLAHGTRVHDLPGFTEGWWSVQDESAMAVAELVAPQPDEHLLDLCAAPGGKSTHLAELAGDQLSITACDVAEHRLDRIRENAQRLNLNSIHLQLISRDGDDPAGRKFDAVLVDVPCSNSGVLARRPEARWRISEAEISDLVQLQTRLLLTALDRTRPGGRIVYSTCSIEPEETTELIANVVSAVPDMQLVEQHLRRPGHGGDGAFQALIRVR
ncbi:MAG: hypothetical protein KDA81_19935, partial [Planctomycetaceae bacterium]|nr:hypothetical protein [Planctomycetaceae bacterium]